MGALDYVKQEVIRATAGAEDASSDIKLTPEQDAVFHEFCSGKNVFFMGCAGTGKSLLLRRIIRWCRSQRKMEESQLIVTAPTGMAAMNIGGSTIHSWAGIGLGLGPADKLLKQLLGDHRYKVMNGGAKGPIQDEPRSRLPRGMRRWLECQVLIIDEISMLEGSLLDKLEYMGRFIRQDHRPFGGIQLVLSGDFLQLPPIGDPLQPPIFAFQSKCWNRCMGKPMLLKTVFRQKELDFIGYLNQLRVGIVTPGAIEFFRSLARPVVYPGGIQPTELFPTKDEVHDKNSYELKKLSGSKQIYKSRDRPGWESKTWRPLTDKALQSAYDRIPVAQELEFKRDAQVMLLKNLVQNGLVNGSLGKIVGYCPARHAWESHEIYLGTALGLAPLSRRIFIGDVERAAREEVERWLNSERYWPIVRFFIGRSRNTVDVCCVPQMFTARHASGGIAAFREQVPLMLSYALTIHKAQGQTLERVKVDLARAFTAGQCYAAISRAVSADALQVLHFDPAKVIADKDVLRFLDRLQNQGDFSIDKSLEFWDDDLMDLD